MPKLSYAGLLLTICVTVSQAVIAYPIDTEPRPQLKMVPSGAGPITPIHSQMPALE